MCIFQLKLLYLVVCEASLVCILNTNKISKRSQCYEKSQGPRRPPHIPCITCWSKEITLRTVCERHEFISTYALTRGSLRVKSPQRGPSQYGAARHRAQTKQTGPAECTSKPRGIKMPAAYNPGSHPRGFFLAIPWPKSWPGPQGPTVHMYIRPSSYSHGVGGGAGAWEGVQVLTFHTTENDKSGSDLNLCL